MDLFELERAFEGDRVVDAATEDEKVVAAWKALALFGLSPSPLTEICSTLIGRRRI
jgi:hypothetical protein